MQMNWSQWYVLISTLMAVGSVDAQELKPFARMDAFLLSDPVSFGGIQNDWRGSDYKGGENQYAATWSEVGVRRGSVSVSGLYREEYANQFSKDTADYYYGDKNRQLVPNRIYQIDLATSHFQAKGLRLAKIVEPSDKLTLEVGVSALQAFGLQAGHINGQVTAAASGKDQVYNARINYFYDEDKLNNLSPRQGVIPPSGLGYAVDASLHWHITNTVDVTASARDLMGEIQWNNAPFTDAEVQPVKITTGSDGYIDYDGGLKGSEGYKSQYTQHLKPKLDAQVRYRLNQAAAASLSLKHIPEKTIWGIGGEIPLSNGTLTATAWSDSKLLTLGYSHKHIDLSVGMDNPKLAAARVFWLGVGVH
jgi:hypothetical protein